MARGFVGAILAIAVAGVVAGRTTVTVVAGRVAPAVGFVVGRAATGLEGLAATVLEGGAMVTTGLVG